MTTMTQARRAVLTDGGDPWVSPYLGAPRRAYPTPPVTKLVAVRLAPLLALAEVRHD